MAAGGRGRLAQGDDRGSELRRRAARVDKGEDVIVGVNKYKLSEQDPIDILDVDNVAVREAQIARIAKVKGRDATRRSARAALDALREGARGTAKTCSGSRSNARAQRATLGEISPPRWRMCSGATTPCRRRFQRHLRRRT